MSNIITPRTKPSFAESYVPVAPDFPCPICGHDSWCVVHRSGQFTLCQRDHSGTPYGKRGRAGYRFDHSPPIKIERCRVRQDDGPPAEHVILAHIRAFRRIRDFQRNRLAWRLGVTPPVIQRLAVGWDEEKRAYTFPMRDGKGHVVGVQYRAWGGQKWSLKGSRLGLFLPDNWREFTRTLYIAEGASDTAALLSAGYPAIGRPSCSAGVDEVLDVVAATKPARVWVVGDRDRVGQRGAIDLAKEIGPAATVVVPFRHRDAREVILESVRGKHSLRSVAVGRRSIFWKVIR